MAIPIQIILPSPAWVVSIPQLKYEGFMFQKQTLQYIDAVLEHTPRNQIGAPGNFETDASHGCCLQSNGLDAWVGSQTGRQE